MCVCMRTWAFAVEASAPHHAFYYQCHLPSIRHNDADKKWWFNWMTSTKCSVCRCKITWNKRDCFHFMNLNFMTEHIRTLHVIFTFQPVCCLNTIVKWIDFLLSFCVLHFWLEMRSERHSSCADFITITFAFVFAFNNLPFGMNAPTARVTFHTHTE